MKIVLNGQAIDTNCKTLYELKREYYGIKDNIVTIIEGFATNDSNEFHQLNKYISKCSHSIQQKK